MITKIKNFILKNKIISTIVLVLIIVLVYFIFFNKKTEINYTSENVKRGDITLSVSGVGQIEASDTITLSPKISGDINYVGVSVGQYVKRGTLIASIDYRDAKNDLELAELNLQDLVTPDHLTLLQKENSLEESRDSAWNTVSSFMNYSIASVGDIEDLYSTDGFLEYKNIMSASSSSKEKVRNGEDSLYLAKKDLEKINKVYGTLSRSSDEDVKENFLKDAYITSLAISSAVKNTETAFNYIVKDFEYSYSDENVLEINTQISSWIKEFNSYSVNLSSAINSIKESTLSYKEALAGEDETSIRQAEISLESKKNNYNDHFIYAPFDGVIATLTAKVGESSGSNIGTLITKENIAVIPFNEVDIASISLGQKVNLTFDAISDLSLEGEVIEIDQVGTVESGVVSYDVKIAISDKNEKIKPGMSVNAEIIIESKKDILLISSSSVKTRGGKSYVEIMKDGNSLKQEVETGISDDSNIEIISGLREGDEIIIKTSNLSSTKNTGMIGTPGMGGAAMGGMLR